MKVDSSRPFTLEPLDKTLGVVVHNVDVRTLDETGFSTLYQAWLKYALLIIPAQHLSNLDQETFALRFGTLIEGLEAVELSNLLPDGRLRDAPDDDMMKIIRGNMHWHQDNTYMPLQAKGAVFSAKRVPTQQGDTAFADMRAAFDALDDETKRLISNRTAHHSLAHSQAQLGEETKANDSEYVGYGLDVDDVPVRPLVKIHPETGHKALAVGRHAYGVSGLSEAESSALILRLNNFAVEDPSRVYQHQWVVGDAVVWDNRCLMHKACPWDYSEPRIMLHSRIAGDALSEAALAV
ncbi:MAG: TauD/TfdA dioxygenase family protein [Pseudomonadales bacterium]